MPPSGPPKLDRILGGLEAEIAPRSAPSGPAASSPEVPPAMGSGSLFDDEAYEPDPEPQPPSSSRKVPPPIDHLFGDTEGSSPDLIDDAPPSIPRGPAPVADTPAPAVAARRPVTPARAKPPAASAEAEAALAALAAEGTSDPRAQRAAMVAIAIGVVVVAGVIALLASLP